jgi:hypothetical protein
VGSARRKAWRRPGLFLFDQSYAGRRNWAIPIQPSEPSLPIRDRCPCIEFIDYHPFIWSMLRLLFIQLRDSLTAVLFAIPDNSLFCYIFPFSRPSRVLAMKIARW